MLRHLNTRLDDPFLRGDREPRPGRPMSASLAGHGAAWPLPNVISAAFHAALHRAFPEPNGDHLHRVKVDGGYSETRTRRFGSLITVGPFPVRKDGALPDLPSECEPPGPAPKSALLECGWKSFCRQESRLYAKRFAIGSFAVTKHCALDARCWRGQIQILVHALYLCYPLTSASFDWSQWYSGGG